MCFLVAERRPLKATVLMPLFQGPSSRLNPQDIMEDDRGRSVDGLNLTSSLEGSSHNEALHYSFMPNKQIVSLSFSSSRFRFLTLLSDVECQRKRPDCATATVFSFSRHSLSSEMFILMNFPSRFVKIAINHNVIMRNLFTLSELRVHDVARRLRSEFVI